MSTDPGFAAFQVELISELRALRAALITAAATQATPLRGANIQEGVIEECVDKLLEIANRTAAKMSERSRL